MFNATYARRKACIKRFKKSITPRVFRESGRAAMSRALKHGRTQSVDVIRSKWNIKKKELIGSKKTGRRGLITAKKDRIKQGIIELHYSDKGKTITRFLVGPRNKHRPKTNTSNKKRKRTKIKVKIFKNKQTVLKRTFLAKNKGLKSAQSQYQFILYRREIGKGKKGKLTVPKTYAITNYVRKVKVTDEIANSVVNMFFKRMYHEISYRTNK